MTTKMLKSTISMVESIFHCLFCIVSTFRGLPPWMVRRKLLPFLKLGEIYCWKDDDYFYFIDGILQATDFALYDHRLSLFLLLKLELCTYLDLPSTKQK